ncbi:hypothetical protein [Pseudomonas mosselii]|uniref:hypothetical protein n=1 Tax=Pseudomonas mosselii TaxID=78327 RepID=UPI000A94B829|nr:hypothetical protein [Pseudomonas mosselii]
MSIDLSKVEADIVHRFVMSVTIPILHELGDAAALLATGTLFKIAGRSFIITARHVFDEVSDLTLLAYPENPLKGSLHTFGDMAIYKPKEEHIDVAVIELLDPETLRRLHAGWQFLELKNVGIPSKNLDDGSVFVGGYPQSLTDLQDGWTTGAFLTAYTQRIPDTPSGALEPVCEDLDMFFDYGHLAHTLTGEPITTPVLKGVSGGSIWEMVEPTSTVWSPDQNVRVIGVQSSFRHSDFIRAKNWWAVAAVLEEVDEGLAAEVHAKLNQRDRVF